MSNRVLTLAALGTIAFGISAPIALTTGPAHGSTCIKRPGISHGSVWWYYRLRNGVRCWYPGPRYASRRVHTRPAALRKMARETRSPSEPIVEMSATRAVHAVTIINGGITINERIERAFDKLMIFPVVEED